MNIMVYEPKKKPYVKDVQSFSEEVKSIVGDVLDFRPIQMDDGTAFQLIVNDVAILKKLPKNRRIYKGPLDYHVVRGTFVVTQVSGDKTVSIDEHYIDFLLREENDFEWATEEDGDGKIDFFAF